MAIQTKKGTAVAYKGKIGDVVLSTWNGIEIMKSAPGTRKKKTTSVPKMAQNALFSLVGKFLNRLRWDVFNKGFQLRKKDRMSAINAATSYHLLNAVSGEYPNYRLNMSRVKFTRPLRSTDTAWNAELLKGDNGSVDIRWEINPFPTKSTQPDDQAYVILYSEDRNIFLIYSKGQRSDLGKHINYSAYFQDLKLYFWLFFISADGKLVSETEYLGMHTMSI